VGNQQDRELVNFLAGKLMLCNQAEVQLIQMAADQLKNPEVKQFAEQVAQDHRQLNEQLKQQIPGLTSIQLGPQQGTARTQPGRPGVQPQAQQRTEQLGQRQPGQQANYQSGSITDQLTKIAQHTVQNNLQMTSECFQEHQGDIDGDFLGQQIGGHMWLISELKAIQEVGPEQLRPFAQQAEQKVQHHLDTAKELAKRFKDERTAQRPAAGRQPRQQ
jgi:predicted outer membrane protein